MALAILAKLMPPQGVLTSETSLENVLKLAKLPLDTWRPVAAALGDADFDDTLLLAAMGPEMIKEACTKAGASPLLVMKVAVVYNMARTMHGQVLVDVTSPPPQVPPPPALLVPKKDASDDEEEKLRVRDYFDQGSRIKVTPQPREQPTELRQKWLDLKKSEPSPGKEYTDNQLSILCGVLKKCISPLSYDGKWRPGGDVNERAMLLTAHVKNQHGDWITREVPASQNLKEWTDQWEFTMAGAVMTAWAEEGILTNYRDEFLKKVEKLKMTPEVWAICSDAEYRCRNKFMPAEKRRQETWAASAPAEWATSYDVNKPWNSIILASCTGAEAAAWWQENLTERVRDYVQARLENKVDNLSGGQSTNDGNDSRRAKRQRDRPSAHQERTNDGEPAPKSARRGDGRYTKDHAGNELCFTWGRNPAGCSDAGCSIKPPHGPRAHGCEYCLGSHRSVRCPNHTGPHPWNAAPKGKGAGKKGGWRK